jgi:hypothetical protein
LDWKVSWRRQKGTLKRFGMYPLDVGHLLRPTSAQSN